MTLKLGVLEAKKTNKKEDKKEKKQAENQVEQRDKHLRFFTPLCVSCGLWWLLRAAEYKRAGVVPLKGFFHRATGQHLPSPPPLIDPESPGRRAETQTDTT